MFKIYRHLTLDFKFQICGLTGLFLCSILPFLVQTEKRMHNQKVHFLALKVSCLNKGNYY